MKPKLRLDKAAIQEFLIQNVEKIVFGLLAMVFLFLVYSALLRVKPFSDTPKKLEDAVSAGQRTLDGTPPETGLEVQDYDVQAKRNHTPITEKPYGGLAVWDTGLFQKPPLRDTPTLYAVQDLRGTAEVGPFRMQAEQAPREAAADPDGRARTPDPMAGMGGTDVRGQRWVVVTGLVQIEKQGLAFAELKSSASVCPFDPVRDSPEYIGYSVQRLEVTSPADAEKPNWDKAETILSRDAIVEAMKQWGQTLNADVVAPEYIPIAQKELVFPLGPLVVPWGESAAHPPEIPLQIGAGMGTGMGMGGMVGDMMRRQSDMMRRQSDMMRRQSDMMRRQQMGGGRIPATPMTPTPAGGGAGVAGEPNPYGGNDAGTLGPDGRPIPEGAMNGVVAAPTNLLFRFFDFNVVPGKQYLYRVRLGLRNPNYKLKVAWLKDPKLADKYNLDTNWSDPTPAISVPRSTRILAVSTKPGRDPSGRILVAKWSRKRGIEAFEEFSIIRGQVADFPDQTFTPPASLSVPGMMGPGGGMMGPGGGMMGPGGGMTGPGGGMMGPGGGIVGPGGRETADPRRAGAGRETADPRRAGAGRETPLPIPGMGRPPMAMGVNAAFPVNYFTRAVAVDFRGGERLRGRRGNSLALTAPGGILLIDSDGALVVHDELDDKPAYDQVTRKEDAAGGADAGAAPAGVHGGALDKMFNRDGTPKKRPPVRGNP